MRPGDALLLYTDGLIDRPDLAVLDGLVRLRDAVDDAPAGDLEALRDHVLAAMAADASGDDVALVCLRIPAEPGDLHLEIAADPAQLSSVRAAISRWLAAHVDDATVAEIVLATSEAVANAAEHAYRSAGGTVEIDGSLVDGAITISIRDHGSWREERRDDDRGRGFAVIGKLVDSVDVRRGDGGTEVRLRRSLARPPREVG